MDYQRVIDRIDDTIVNRPGRIILAFLALTAVFTLGLGNISTAAGTSQFTTGLPAEEAFDEVQTDFNPPFSTDTGSTQLIQSHPNVLSKPALVRMLTAQERLNGRPSLRVTSTSSAAGIVARQLDPSARTPAEQREAVEDATPGQIDAAVQRAAAENERFASIVSDDFNRRSSSASATIGIVDHEVPSGLSTGSGQGGSSPLTPLQERSKFVVESVGGGITVFGSGIIANEFSSVITDSLLIVVPAAVILITLFLIVAYRDLVDLLLGVSALAMTIIWTFGFMGLAGIAFSQMLIAVPPLLLAVGIDFGIHAINRYREETVTGKSISESMRITTDQLIVAFFIVTGTTVIGFASNFTSSLPPIKDFGLVAAIGIVFTFLIFGIFLPALKTWVDYKREDYPIPTFSTTPLGSEDSKLSGVLRIGVSISDVAPVAFLLIVLVGTAGAGYYATGVDTSFAQEDFLPPEDNPDWIMDLPEPFRPNDYTVTETTNFLEDKFSSTQSSSATIYVEGPMEKDYALESIHKANQNPPDSFVSSDREAQPTSILSVIQQRAERDEEFARLVARNDLNDNGVPDDDLGEIYNYLLASDSRDRALEYMTADRRSARVVYTVKSDAEQSVVTNDARAVADDYQMTAIATGQIVVFQAVSDVILESALVSLAVALAGATLFLLFAYRLFEGAASLGAANIVPIVMTVTLVAASMRFFSIPFNAITATILAITIGLGIDYSVHVTHRFADEREMNDLNTALDRTVRGTGGALLGSMVTTVSGIGVLALALFPAIGQFGILTGLSIFYAFVASVFVLPSVLVIWDRFFGPDHADTDTGTGPAPRPELGPEPATGTPNPDVDIDSEDD
jgi:predicted RND superfamily exporter protein